MKKNAIVSVSKRDLENKQWLREKFHDGNFKVCIFGSARVKPDNPVYQEVAKLADAIAHAGYDLVTGGGPGVMEAASKGHAVHSDICEKCKDTDTIGVNIQLPHEQAANPYLTFESTHATFSTRLDTFMLLSNAVVVAPGGIGTALELFYTWQLMQVHHICKMPLILMWPMYQGLVDWVRENLVEQGLMDPEDLDMVVRVDTWEEAFRLLQEAHACFEEAGDGACVNINQYLAAVRQLGLGE